MSDAILTKVLELLLGTVCFGCFAWGTIWHFRWEGNGSRGAWVVSLLSWCGYFDFVWQVSTNPAPPGRLSCWFTLCLMLAAFLFWAWTVRTTRANPPTLAYTQDMPKAIFRSGPYAWVRHPFYAAYLCFWLATALADRGVLGALICASLGAIYFAAARQEEAKFARSDLAGCYARYRDEVGMFFPRIVRRARRLSSAADQPAGIAGAHEARSPDMRSDR